MRAWSTAVVLALTGGALPASTAVHTVVQQDAWLEPRDAPQVSVSADGRFVAFASYARLAPADTNDARDVYVLDRRDNLVTLESIGWDRLAASAGSEHPRLSADARFLVFRAVLLDQASSGRVDIVLRDRASGSMRVVNLGVGGVGANGSSIDPTISADGRHVVFASHATNLVAGTDRNGSAADIYAFDARTGTLERVSLDGRGGQPDSGGSTTPSISRDGRLIAFASMANLDGTLGANERSPVSAVYVRDRQLGTTRRVSARASGTRTEGASSRPVLSADGRFVAFVSTDSALVPDDRNRLADVLLADLQTGGLTLVSRRAGGGSGNGASGNPAISADGRYIAFQSEASDLICSQDCPATLEDINLLWDVFVFDRRAATVARVSGGAGAGWMEPSIAPALAAGGELIAFSSRHPTEPTDLKNDFDLFLCSTAGGN